MSDFRLRFVTTGKDRFMPLLLLGDEQREAVERYLYAGALYVGSVKGEDMAVCVICPDAKTSGTDTDAIEIKNIAIAPAYRRQGFGRRLLQWVETRYPNRVLTVGTGEAPSTMNFYRSCGFRYARRVPDFFTLNYDHPVIDDGILLKDMIYFTKDPAIRPITSSTMSRNQPHLDDATTGNKSARMRPHKNLLAIAISAFILIACQPQGYRPQNGDLLFIVAPDTAGSAFSNAITAATAQRDSIKFSHVAIVAVTANGTPYVVEASSRCGVARTGWDDFFAAAQPVNGQPGVVVMRVADPCFPMDEAIARAESHIGQAYDWSFYPDNGQLYCSELVYESFRQADGSPLFTARPMNFRDADGHMPAFWTELFDRLGEPVPEGVPGTNPNDLAKESVLNEVWRFF